MSNNLTLDVGLEVGKADGLNDADLSYLKLKLGKGKEESLAIKAIVEAGTGKTLLDNEHYLSMRVPANANTDELKETIEGLTDEGLLEEIDGKNGEKW